MGYYAKIVKKKKGLLASFLFLAALGLALLANFTGFGKEFRSAVFSVNLPIQKFLWNKGASLAFFLKAGEGKARGEDLRQKVELLTAELAMLSEIKKENDVLREALGLSLEKEFSLELAQTISKDSLGDFLIIDKGSENGIEKGMAVITGSKRLIGKVDSTERNFSKVVLFTSDKSAFDSKVSGKEILGLVKGQGGLKASFDLVPLDADLQNGDKLITLSLGGIYPEGLLVGEIKNVRRNDVEAFKQAEIIPFSGFNEFTDIFVLKKKK